MKFFVQINEEDEVKVNAEGRIEALQKALKKLGVKEEDVVTKQILRQDEKKVLRRTEQ